MTAKSQHKDRLPSRRGFLKRLAAAPLLLRPAPLFGLPFLPERVASAGENPALSFKEARLRPQYPAESPLADVLRLVVPGSDEYGSEASAVEIEALLERWSLALRADVRDQTMLSELLFPLISGSKLANPREVALRSGFGIDAMHRSFGSSPVLGREPLLAEIKAWLSPLDKVETAEFQVFSITEDASVPGLFQAGIRYDLVSTRRDGRREERVGTWLTEWSRARSQPWRASKWIASEETLSLAKGPGFIDVSGAALGVMDSYGTQMLRGVDHWRTVLDGACGIDIYSNNGVAAGDFDNDGFDDLYICQPAGLPNRLYRNRGDGTFEDVTATAGVGVLDNTACSLFADFRNKGLQDLLVVCGSGPLLFLNQGDGTFTQKRDAFRFAQPPQGTFTHAALADYDRDGRLDIFFCMYQYYLGLDQYHYPVPYYDARNGPPNSLLHNEGDGVFIERTEAAGLNVENNRYSFACAWGDSNADGLPDLCIANDFGSTQLYRNSGDGTFKLASAEAHVEDVGAGMSACWADTNNDGRQDIYITSMWEAAGQRVSGQKQFHEQAPARIRELYQRHARGNALYRNQGEGKFLNVGKEAAVEMGRWSWSADFWDFDHDGFADLYVTNGYISATDRDDLAGFFWRQVVARSPEDATPSTGYERGWNAINELIRSDYSWNACERNVLFANNRDGTFAEVSGLLGLDFGEDSRTFALADIDHDGRLEVILKNRNAPQLRILHNAIEGIGQSVTFRLKGTTSNRDAIGSSITVEAGDLQQTKYLQAGSGFLAQHSKEVVFGVGRHVGGVRATVRWPTGRSQVFEGVPVGNRIQLEEGKASFTAVRFTETPVLYRQRSPSSALEPLPRKIDTWLINPFKAPDFTLADLVGKTRRLESLRGGFVLVTFWRADSSECLKQLHALGRRRPGIDLAILAVNVDEGDQLATAKTIAAAEGVSSRVLLASEEMAGTYNIVYRYLFDRRRDLPLPASFLIDKEGMIIKLYQGAFDLAQVLGDLAAVPSSPVERIAKALPMKGEHYQGAFVRNDFTIGVAMFQHGYLEQAAQSFQQVIAAKPDYPEGYYNLGTLNLRRNNLEQAKVNLEQSVKLRPDYPEAWNNLGMIAARVNRPQEAIDNFERSIRYRPTYAIALLNLGNLYRRQKDFRRALDCLSRAFEIEPMDSEVNYGLGMLYAQQGQLPRAQEYLQRALALRPAYAEALNNLGVVYVQLRDYVKAREEFETCIRLVPAFDQSYINLSGLAVMQGDKDKARKVLQQLLVLEPQNQSAKQALSQLQ